jgi:hypothetical protein
MYLTWAKRNRWFHIPLAVLPVLTCHTIWQCFNSIFSIVIWYYEMKFRLAVQQSSAFAQVY